MASKPPPGFTSEPQATQPPSFPDAFTPSSSSSSSSAADPPPPLPANPDEPTESDDAALKAWLLRNISYINVPWNRYPSLPALSPLWGYTDSDFRAECLDSLLFYTRAAGRKLTDDEREAVLATSARTAVAVSYDRPVALGLAIWGMARSWSKSGLREMIRRSGDAAANTTTPGVGTIGADGHITHFSIPQGQQSGGFFQMGGAARGAIVKSLFRRVARTSTVGLSCAAAYYTLSTPWRFLLGNHEVDAIRDDLRLGNMCRDMDQNLKAKMGEIVRKHGGL